MPLMPLTPMTTTMMEQPVACQQPPSQALHRHRHCCYERFRLSICPYHSSTKQRMSSKARRDSAARETSSERQHHNELLFCNGSTAACALHCILIQRAHALCLDCLS